MIQYIELIAEPLTILTLAFVTFYGFGWLLCKIAEWLGVECDEDDKWYNDSECRDYIGFSCGFSYFSFWNRNGIKKYQWRFGLNEARRFGGCTLWWGKRNTMYWFSFGSQKSRSKKVQQHEKRDRRESTVVVAVLADWMVARGPAKVSKWRSVTLCAGLCRCSSARGSRHRHLSWAL